MAYKINDLTALGRNLASNDLLEVSLVGGTGSRKMTGGQLIGGVVNPTSNLIPFNSGGSLADSPLSFNGSNTIQTSFTGLPGNGNGGIQIIQSSGIPFNYYTTTIGDYSNSGGYTTLTVQSNGGILGSTMNGQISFVAAGQVTLQDITQANRVVLGGSALQWNGSFGGPKGGSNFSLPIYLTGLGMTVNIPLYT